MQYSKIHPIRSKNSYSIELAMVEYTMDSLEKNKEIIIVYYVIVMYSVIVLQ